MFASVLRIAEPALKSCGPKAIVFCAAARPAPQSTIREAPKNTLLIGSPLRFNRADATLRQLDPRRGPGGGRLRPSGAGRRRAAGGPARTAPGRHHFRCAFWITR